MKFLARKSDGQVLSRFEDSRLTFPIPSNCVVYDSPVDIPAAVLPVGSSASDFALAKVNAFAALHPTFTSWTSAQDECLEYSGCDLTESSLISLSRGKRIAIRPGGYYVSVLNSGFGTATKPCMRFRAYILGRKTGKRSSYYNFDELTQTFVSPPVLTASLVDASSLMPIVTLVSDVEGESISIPDYRVTFYNGGSRTVFLSDWTIIFATLIF